MRHDLNAQTNKSLATA